MPQGRVRAIAVAVIRRSGDIFVAEYEDTVKQETFYRPLGGTIEFGEPSRETVARELREEIGAEVIVGRYLGAIENIFVNDGAMGHEIAMIYEAHFTDAGFYERETVDGEEDNQSSLRAVWKPLEYFRSTQAPLYPTGLLELLGG